MNPVADLADFGLCGTIGEVVYVSVFDSEGCEANAANHVFRTESLHLRLRMEQEPEQRRRRGAAGAESKFANIAGVAVDDDGSLYYQLLDLIQFTGGAIFKSTELCRTVAGLRGSESANQSDDPVDPGSADTGELDRNNGKPDCDFGRIETYKLRRWLVDDVCQHGKPGVGRVQRVVCGGVEIVCGRRREL